MRNYVNMHININMIEETEMSWTHELKGQTLVGSAIFRKFPQLYLLTLALT